MRFRWPAGTYWLHAWKVGLRTSVMWSLGTYSEITYGPVATRQRPTVEMSLFGVPLGTANANGIAMYSRKVPSGWVRWKVIARVASLATIPLIPPLRVFA